MKNKVLKLNQRRANQCLVAMLPFRNEVIPTYPEIIRGGEKQRANTLIQKLDNFINEAAAYD